LNGLHQSRFTGLRLTRPIAPAFKRSHEKSTHLNLIINHQNKGQLIHDIPPFSSRNNSTGNRISKQAPPSF